MEFPLSSLEHLLCVQARDSGSLVDVCHQSGLSSASPHHTHSPRFNTLIWPRFMLSCLGLFNRVRDVMYSVDRVTSTCMRSSYSSTTSMTEGHLDAVQSKDNCEDEKAGEQYVYRQDLIVDLRLEHCLQASGEAVYTSDVALGGDELYCYPVESTQALAMLVSVDASKALEVMTFCS